MNGAQILVLGLAYKRNTGDARASPALLVIERLVDLGAAIRVCDPLVRGLDVPAAFEFVSFNESELAAASLVLVLTDHDDLTGRPSSVSPTRSSTLAIGCPAPEPKSCDVA